MVAEHHQLQGFDVQNLWARDQQRRRTEWGARLPLLTEEMYTAGRRDACVYLGQGGKASTEGDSIYIYVPPQG